jgi:hypothetical protein
MTVGKWPAVQGYALRIDNATQQTIATCNVIVPPARNDAGTCGNGKAL